MPKKSRFAPSQVEHMRELVAEVERRREARAFGEHEVESILAAIQSSDERTRARAVREICPCRMPWEAFDRLRPAAKRLQHDPSPEVRANARHIEQDAREVASMESLSERYQEYQEVEGERRERDARRFRRGGRGRV